MDARGRARAGGRRARRGLDRAAHADGQRGPRPDQRHGRHARDAAARPPRPRATAEGRGRDRGDVDGGPAWHRPRLRGRPHRDAPPARSAASGPTSPVCSPARPSSRATATTTRACRTRTAALRSAGQRRRARHLRLRAERGRRGAESGDRQPGGDARRARGVVRELPRRTCGAGLRLPGDRRRRAGRDRGAPHGPHARPEPLIRAAAVPRRGRRGQLRADARPLHAGRDGRREPQAVRAREHGLAAHERDAGGPRVDGLGRGPQAPHRARERRAHPGGGAHLRSAGARPARPARAGGRHGRCTSIRAGDRARPRA